jgi:hypothetical protein
VTTPEQVRRWATDYGATLPAVGQKIDSIRFEEAGGERVTLVLSSGMRLRIGVQGGALRAWVFK